MPHCNTSSHTGHRPPCFPGTGVISPGDHFQLVFVTNTVYANPNYGPLGGQNGGPPPPAGTWLGGWPNGATTAAPPGAPIVAPPPPPPLPPFWNSVSTASWDLSGTPPFALSKSIYDDTVNELWKTSPLYQDVSGWLGTVDITGDPYCDLALCNIPTFRAIVSTANGPYAADISNAKDTTLKYYFPPPPSIPPIAPICMLGTKTQDQPTDVSGRMVVLNMSGLFNQHAGDLSNNINQDPSGVRHGGIYEGINAVWTGTNPEGGGIPRQTLGFNPYTPPGTFADGYNNPSSGYDQAEWDFTYGVCDSSSTPHWIDKDKVPTGGMTSYVDPSFARLYAISQILKMPGTDVCPPPPSPSSPRQLLVRYPFLPDESQVPKGGTFQLAFVTSTIWKSEHTEHIAPHRPPVSTCHHDYDMAVRQVWHNSTPDISWNTDISWNAIVTTQTGNASPPSPLPPLPPPYDGSGAIYWDPNGRGPNKGSNKYGVFTISGDSISKQVAKGGTNSTGNVPLWDVDSGTWLQNPININENGQHYSHDHHDISRVWTGTANTGESVPYQAMGWGKPPDSAWPDAVTWMTGMCDASSAYWVQALGAAVTQFDDGLRLYALSEVLRMPYDDHPPQPDPPLPTFRIAGKISFPGKAPIPKAPFCRPLCEVYLEKLSVTQPAPPSESTKMRNAKRIKGRGWRKMSLKQYNEMKRGGLPFLGTCYQKKNH